MHQYHLTTLARLCVFCLLSALRPSAYFKENIKRKRTSSQSDSDVELLTCANKLRKFAIEGPENTCPNDYQIEENADTIALQNTIQYQANIISTKSLDVWSNALVPLTESLETSLHRLFHLFQYWSTKGDYSPTLVFISNFIHMLFKYGGDQGRIILRLLPLTVIQALSKLSPPFQLNAGVVIR